MCTINQKKTNPRHFSLYTHPKFSIHSLLETDPALALWTPSSFALALARVGARGKITDKLAPLSAELSGSSKFILPFQTFCKNRWLQSNQGEAAISMTRAAPSQPSRRAIPASARLQGSGNRSPWTPPPSFRVQFRKSSCVLARDPTI
jgi:hypothetical protein